MDRGKLYLLSVFLLFELVRPAVTSSVQLSDDDLDATDSLFFNAVTRARSKNLDDDVQPSWFKLVLGKRMQPSPLDARPAQIVLPLCARLCTACWQEVSLGKELLCRLECANEQRGAHLNACVALVQRMVSAPE